MARILRGDRIVEDNWQQLVLAADQAPETIRLPSAPTLLPLAVWLARRHELLASDRILGVWLDSHQGPEDLAGDLDRLAVVAVNFPKFTDGRSYSSARLLRERYGYRGEIRAIGDVLQDQLFSMWRCGIDAFALRADKDPEQALAGLKGFSESYQAAVDQPQPLFRRRLQEART